MAASDVFERAAKLHGAGKLDAAIDAYREAVRLDEGLHPAWYGLGCAWDAKRDHAAALPCFQKAVSLAPNHHASQHNLGKTLFALGLADEAIERFRAAIGSGGGFLSRTAIATSIPGCPGADNRAVLEARRQWAEYHLPPPDPDKHFRRARRDGRRLRIGYFSSFFKSPNWMKPVWGLLRNHDRRRFEIHWFSEGPEADCGDSFRRNPADTFHDISPLSNGDAAALIERTELDLLVDLNGYSHVDRMAVVALRPAPIVVAWFNFYATSGMAGYDVLIGDRHTLPPEEEAFYTERVLRVPGSYLTFEVLYPVPDVAAGPVQSGTGLTFGSLASQYKITPPVVAAWAEILRRSPGATLLVKNATLGRAANREFLLGRFEEHGIARERIALEGPAEHFDFLAAYDRIDVALDTFPYNGGTTTCEAIWQGVPVVTFRGDRWAARQSTSILCEAGLDEFVADDLDAYVSRAAALANSPGTPGRLAELRSTMRSRLARASICDTATFATNMEDLYTRIFDEWWSASEAPT